MSVVQLEGNFVYFYLVWYARDTVPVRLTELCLFETNSSEDKNTFVVTRPVENNLKSGEDLLSFLFNTALEYAIRNVQANQNSLKLIVTCQHLVSAGRQTRLVPSK
jgi:hypothetical protein